jgi:pyruvate kinase
MFAPFVPCRIGMTEAKIIAKIENMEGLVNYREIMEQCDVMLLSRGSMGNCVDPEKMFLAQKMLLRVRPDRTCLGCQC